jgi:putative tryptophan/tyrosine transport system substrate-binding protein
MDIDRRQALVFTAAMALCAASPVGGQPARKARVAWVTMERANPQAPFWVSFRSGMRALGWVEGQNVTIDPWWVDGSVERLKLMIPDIVASRPDIIVVTTGTAVRPMIDANVPTPLVFGYSADPVIGKIVESWTRPGVNRTGVSYFSIELVPKRLEFIKQLLPHMKRIAIVGWPAHAGELLELDAAKAAASRLGLEHQYFGVSTGPEVDAALESIGKWRADAMLAFAGAIASVHADRFAAFSARSRIPTVSAWPQFAEAGNLMTYGPVIQEAQERLASFVDRILKGANPAEIPVELPTKIELVINLKTAKAIDLVVPQSLRLRADRLIE